MTKPTEFAIENFAIKLFERLGYDYVHAPDIALGVADDIRNAQHLNRVTTFGLLAMDAWVFDR